MVFNAHSSISWKMNILKALAIFLAARLHGTGPPPWSDLRGQLSDLLGVHDVQIVEEVQLVPEVQTVGGQQVTVHVERYERAVIVTYNRMNVGVEDVALAIGDAGFEAGPPENISRVGKAIVIPPDSVG